MLWKCVACKPLHPECLSNVYKLHSEESGSDFFDLGPLEDKYPTDLSHKQLINITSQIVENYMAQLQATSNLWDASVYVCFTCQLTVTGR